MNNVCLNIAVYRNFVNQCKVLGGWQQSFQGEIDEVAILDLSDKKKLTDKSVYNQYTFLIKKMAPIMDEIMGTSYGKKWSIILGPFIINHLQFYNSCQAMISQIKDKNLTLFAKNYKEMKRIGTPKDFGEFSKILYSIEGQEQIFVDFAINHGVNVKYIDINHRTMNLNAPIRTPNKKISRRKLKKTAAYLRNFWLRFFPQFPRTYIPNIPNSSGLTLFLELLGLVYVAPTQLRKKKLSLATNNTRELIFDRLDASLGDDECKIKIYIKMLKRYLPLSYIENHSIINYFPRGKKINAALSSHSHITSDDYRLWLAQKTISDPNFKIGVYQHGGFGLVSLTQKPMVLWEQKIADRYFTWGSGSALEANKNHVAGIRKCRVIHPNIILRKRITKILIVIEQPPLSPCDIKSFKTWKKTLQDTAWLAKSLDDIGIQNSVQLYHDTTVVLQQNILLRNYKDIKFSKKRKKMSINTPFCTLVIFTYISSGFFERIMASKPAVVWTQNEYNIDKRYVSLYREMNESFLFFRDKEKLLNRLSLGSQGLSEWWIDESVVGCRRRIKDLFAQSPKNLLPLILRMKN